MANRRERDSQERHFQWPLTGRTVIITERAQAVSRGVCLSIPSNPRPNFLSGLFSRSSPTSSA